MYPTTPSLFKITRAINSSVAVFTHDRALIVPRFVSMLPEIWCKRLTGEEVSIDKQVACEECPRWLKMTEVA